MMDPSPHAPEHTCFTIGYERSELPELAQALRAAGAATVIDVRAAPHSRRRAFARKHLGPRLAEHGIGYLSWPVLGAPEPAREAARAGDAARFHHLYTEHLATPEAQQALEALAEQLRREPIALLCYERDPAQCHRMLIAEALEGRYGATIAHLEPAPARGG